MAQLTTISFKKSRRPFSIWVVETDVATGQAKPPHLSTSAFSDDFYRDFAGDNNCLVSYANAFGFDLGDDYATFYQLGMRVSQQLDGPLRELTADKYAKLLQKLQEKTVEGVLFARTAWRDSELDALVAAEMSRDELSAEDLGSVREMARAIQNVPLDDCSQSFLGRKRFGDQLSQIMMCDEYRGLWESYWLVPPGVRRDYFTLMMFAPLHGLNPNYMVSEELRLVEMIEELGCASARTYIHSLLALCGKDHYQGYMFFDETYQDILLLNPEQRVLYLSTLERVLDVGMDAHIEGISLAAAQLLERHGTDDASRVIDNAFLLYRDGKTERDVLNNMIGKY